jgi:hypothetical protein
VAVVVAAAQFLRSPVRRVGYNGGVVTTHSLFPPSDLGVAPEVDERYCLGCGYNLRGLDGSRDGGRCPECGRPIDRFEHQGLRAPWVHRHRIGAFAAYWQTAALVTFRPGEFAARFHWPRVRFHGSNVFRRWTVCWAASALVLAAAAVAWRYGVGATAAAAILGALAPSALLLMYGATELAAFFTGPRLATDTSEELFRAQMVNDYASAALAWTPAPALVLLAGVWAGKMFAPTPLDTVLFMIAGALAAWVGVLWVGGVLVLFGKALSLSTYVLVLAAVVFPVRFAGLILLTALFVFAPLVSAATGLISLAR